MSELRSLTSVLFTSALISAAMVIQPEAAEFKGQSQARDIFVSHRGVPTCELRVVVRAKDEPTSMASTAEILLTPPFLEWGVPLSSGPLEIQVGSVKYGPSTTFRAVVNRPCQKQSIQSVRTVIKELAKRSVTTEVSIDVVGNYAPALPPKIQPIDLRATFYLFQKANLRPADCTIEIISDDWLHGSATTTLIAKRGFLLSKYRLPILFTVHRNDRMYLLAYDRCLDPASVAKDYLASAALEGVAGIPTSFKVTRTTLSDVDVATLFAFKPD